MSSNQALNNRDTTGNYILHHDTKERRRLERQHVIFKKFLNRDSPIPPTVDIENTSNVLDAAAGTLVWTLDLANMPEVASRLLPISSSPIHLYACDLTMENFPPEVVIAKYGIQTFKQDLTQPFPEDMKGKFDLVNMRFLVLAFTEEGWKRALKNVAEILKPGGLFVLFECNSQFYTKDDAARSDFPQEPPRIDSWIYAANRMVVKNSEVNGHIYNLATRLPDLVQSSSLKIVSQTSVKLPMGVLCKTEPGPFGQSLAEDKELTDELFFTILEFFSRYALQAGFLEGVEGKICDEEGRQRFVNSFKQKFSSEGAYIFCTELVVKL